MGMAASQARYLSLVARQSNLEYQGQQINQERTILSQQVSELYNSLLTLEVPTPPSTQEFTKIEYSGSDGATNFNIGNVKPSGENYIVEIQTTATGAAISPNYGTSICSTAPATIKGTTISTQHGTNTYKGDGTFSTGTPLAPGRTAITGATAGGDADLMGLTKDEVFIKSSTGEYVHPETFNSSTGGDIGTNYYIIVPKSRYDADSSANYESIFEIKEDNSYPLSNLSNFYVNDGTTLRQLSPADDGGLINITGNTFTINTAVLGTSTIFQAGEGTEEMPNPDAGKTTIAGKTAYDFDTAAALYPEYDWAKYEEAIRNTYGQQEDALTKDDFYVFFTTSDTGVTEVQFALKSDVDSPDKFAKTFGYTPNGTFTKSEEKDQCRLEFDATGRITKIGIPEYDKVSGELVSWREIELQAITVTDEIAYDNAMTQYEYKQHLYDKEQQKIQARTETIQQMDRNLELKLQRLDNERKMITTEIEALDKVINENIEKSFKTFSG